MRAGRSEIEAVMPSLSIQLPDISRALVARICTSWYAQVWRPVWHGSGLTFGTSCQSVLLHERVLAHTD